MIVLVFMVIIVAALCLSAVMMSSSDSRDASFLARKTQALYVAQAGLQDTVRQMSSMRNASRLDAPFLWYESLNGSVLHDGTLLSKDGIDYGQYDVTVTAVVTVDSFSRDIRCEITGYVPSKDALRPATRTIDAVIRVTLGRSEVFDYVYFLNNWGWYYGSTIIANGNVRSNGQFDGGGYRATINAIPRFAKLEGSDFTGKIDDGGMMSGWNIVNAGNMRGDANVTWTQADADAGKCSQDDVGDLRYQRTYQDQLPMPNLSNLTMYEDMAKDSNSTIKIGGNIIVAAVQGDESGEQQHLYLKGTAANPIVIDGLVVVRGGLIISGVLTGKGAIYSGGNVYVPNNLTYANPPTTPVTNPDEAAMENWVATTSGADALGLFAREHVVVGDYTHNSWQYYVSSWVGDWRNKSEEDAGEDGIPNTRAGRDGVHGTSDDDVLEDDNDWTSEVYTAMHEEEGLIPEGSIVGDAIPGSGEDIDGDGVYDNTCLMSEFNIPASLTSTNWAGNVPAGNPSYSSISNVDNITQLDAAFYTNHHFAMLTLAWGKDMTFNGCIVSRNESIVYGTSHLILNYDYRLMGGGQSHGFYLPRTWDPVAIVYWTAR